MIDLLEKESQIVGATGAACVQVVDRYGNWTSLEDRIKQLKTDQRFCNSIPHADRISRTDQQGLRDNFARIAEGHTVVE
jgi:hypothetical protein